MANLESNRGAEDHEGILGRARDAVLGMAAEVRQAGERVKEIVRGQPDALQLLKKDHEIVDSLFAQLEVLKQDEKDRSSADLCEGLFAQLDYELSTHATVEEKLFYPALKKARAEKADELLAEALAEHQQMKQLLAELASTKIGTQAWNGKLKALKDTVQHHVQEEERDLFKLAHQAMDEKQLRELGLRLEQEKQRMAQAPEGSQPVQAPKNGKDQPASL